MSWRAVHISPTARPLNRDALIRTLFEAGATGIEESGTMLVTCFPDGTDLGPVVRGIETADSSARVETVLLPDVDWTERWKSGLRAHAIGRLTVGPPWAVDGADAHAVAIEPAMAFGTGEHASTRGALRLLQDAVRPGDVIADLGAGSGVLAIAAAKLGAARVVAVEIDADGISNAEANVARNLVGDRVHVIAGDARVLLPLLAPVRVIVANILAPVLMEMLPAMAAALAPAGVVILGGMLVSEREVVVDALAREHWLLAAETVERDGEDEGINGTGETGETGETAWWSVTLGQR